tara:strand:+ start:500 stop:1711 length:1212 start_codon:yes stop_codon:yes gene_type:complete
MANSFWVGSNVAVRNDYEVYLSQTAVTWNELFQLYPNSAIQMWGINDYGQLADGSVTSRSSPVGISKALSWKNVALGKETTWAIANDDSLWASGRNNLTQLGIGTAGGPVSTPVQVGTATTWQSVQGYLHALAIQNSNSMWSWGDNQQGELGLNDTSQRSAPVLITAHGNIWMQASAGQFYSAAISVAGDLYMWGVNSAGQLGFGDTVSRSTPVMLSGNKWVQVVTASSTAEAIPSNSHTLAIRQDNTLWAWGYNDMGQLGDGTTVDKNSPIQIGSEAFWISVAVGANHSMAIRSDGSLYAWGDNSSGKLGLGDTTDRSSPVQVGNLNTWRQVKCSQINTYAIKSNGTLWAWGSGTQGQLGNNSISSVSSPVQVGLLDNWKSLQAGNLYAGAISWPKTYNSPG